MQYTMRGFNEEMCWRWHLCACMFWMCEATQARHGFFMPLKFIKSQNPKSIYSVKQDRPDTDTRVWKVKPSRSPAYVDAFVFQLQWDDVVIRRCGFVYINQPEFHIFLRQCPHCPMYNVYIFIYNNVHTVHYKSNRPRGKVHYPEDLGTGQSDFFRTNCPFKYLLPPESVRRCHPSGSDGNSSHRQLFSPNFRLMTLAAPGFVQQRTKKCGSMVVCTLQGVWVGRWVSTSR